MQLTGWTWHEVKRVLAKHRTRSPLVDQWRQSKVAPSITSAERLADVVPGSRELFCLPLWPLLANKTRSEADINRIRRSFQPDYALPDEAALEDRRDEEYRYAFPVSDYGPLGLVMSGTLRSLSELVLSLRTAEANSSHISHSETIASIYWTLPTIFGLEYVTKYSGDLLNAIRDLHARVEYSRIVVQPNLAAIDKSLERKAMLTNREATLWEWMLETSPDCDNPVRRHRISVCS